MTLLAKLILAPLILVAGIFITIPHIGQKYVTVRILKGNNELLTTSYGAKDTLGVREVLLKCEQQAFDPKDNDNEFSSDRNEIDLSGCLRIELLHVDKILFGADVKKLRIQRDSSSKKWQIKEGEISMLLRDLASRAGK